MEQFRGYDDLADCGSGCFSNRIDAEISLLTNVYLYRFFYLSSQTRGKLLSTLKLLEMIFNKRTWNIVFFKVFRRNNNCRIECTIFDILFDVYNGLNASL